MLRLEGKSDNTTFNETDMFISNGKVLDVPHTVWQKNEGILRQALLNSEKEVKIDEKMLPIRIVDISEPDRRKRISTDMVEAIQLYSTGTDGTEFSSHLLSELTSTSLPMITSSQISSVLSELEPLNHLFAGRERISRLNSEAQETCGSDTIISNEDKDKNPNTETEVKVMMEKHECGKRIWFKCAQCELICFDENRAASHIDRCRGPINKVSCIACDNRFKSTAVLKAHLFIDHSITINEHTEFFALNLGLDEKQHNEKHDEAAVVTDVTTNNASQSNNLDKSSLPPTPGFSLFESVEKFIVDSNNTSESNVQASNDSTSEIKRDKKINKLLKKSENKITDVKLEKEIGTRCGLEGCSVRLATSSNMEYHRQCHNGVKLKCIECGLEFPSWANLSLHLWKSHEIDMELYSCDQCSYKTNSLSKLMNLHRRTHGDERPFLCDLCGKGFKTTKQLRNHKAIHKTKEKIENEQNYSCDICGRAFTCDRMLRHHKDIVHRKLRPYLCSECGHSAASRSSLRMHSRQHTGEKPYSCSECDYKTSDHNTLRRHRMWHTGAKKYTCPHCPYASIQSSTFKSHLKKKHPGLDEGLMFSCEICPFKTVKKENYLAHTSYHSIKIGSEDMPKEAEVDIQDYNLRHLVKEVSGSILPCATRNYMSNTVVGGLKAEQILSRQHDPLLAATRQDIISDDP